MKRKSRIAVVSPFLDKRHGTERCVAEQIERLADDYEVHLYSSEVQDLDLSKITWHKTGRRFSPHLLSYCWFFFANHLARFWDRRFHGLDFDIVFSPGINCLDADIIAVHIVFAEYCRMARQGLRFRRNSLAMWPRLIHRRLSYRLFISLEAFIYARQNVPLIVISRKMQQDLARNFRRTTNLYLLYHGVDPNHMNPKHRENLRAESRSSLSIPDEAFAILLIGNDWKKKGLYPLFEAVGSLRNPRLWILVRGDDDSSLCQDAIQHFGLEGRVLFLPSIPEIDPYYAASDLYIGPSLEDSFAIPPLEAMASGLPVVVSAQAGVSEIITHGLNGFIINDPTDIKALAEFIGLVFEGSDLRYQIGLCAASTAQAYTWERNGEGLKQIIADFLAAKESPLPLDKPAMLAGR